MPEILGTSKSISGFDPRSIPGCCMWFDAADSSTFTPANPSNGQTVTQWRDKSSNSNHLVQATAATVTSSGSYSTTGYNGKPAVFMNPTGVSSYGIYSTQAMWSSNTLNFQNFFPSNDTNTFFMVFSQTGGIVGAMSLQWTNNGSGNSHVVQDFGSGNLCASGPGINSNIPKGMGANLMVEWVTRGLSSTSESYDVYVYGAPGGTITYLNTSDSGYTWNFTERFVIGAKDSNAAYYGIGYHAEYIMYNKALTTAQRQAVEGYLAWKWGLECIPQANLVPGVPPAGILAGIPTDIGGCVLWLDGADTSTFRISSGTTIDTWVDKSGNSYNATPYGTGTTVTYDYSSKAVYFPGSAGLKTSLVTPTNRVQSGFFVATVSSTSVGVIQGCSNSYGGRQFRTTGTLTSLKENTSGLLGSGTTPVNTLMLVGYTDDGTTITHSVNGTTTSGTSATAFTSGTTVTLGYSFNTEYMVGYINEAIIYSNALSSTQRQQVEGYLGKKWGITVPTSPAFTGLSLWLDASDTTTLFQNTAGTTPVTADGQSVACWKDKSGNGYLFTQATSGNQPTFKTAVMNGQNTLRWNGTSQYLQSSTTLPFFSTPSSGGTFFFVFNASQISAQRCLLHYQNATSGSYCVNETDIAYTTGATAQGNFGFHRGCGNAAVALLQVNQLQANENLLMTGVLGTSGTSPANVQIFKNGRASTVQNDGTGYYSAGSYPSSNNARYMNIGSRYLYGISPDCYHLGDIAEILWFNIVLTSTQRQEVESYLSTKWGIPMYGNGYTPLLNSPSNIPGCVLWLDAADTTTITDVSQPTPLSYFPFDGSIVDQSNVITLTRTGSVPYVTGKYGQAVSFTNASGQYSSNYLSTSYNLSSTFTVAFWFQTPSASPNAFIFGTAPNSGYSYGGICAYLAGGNLYHAYSHIQNGGVVGAVSPNTWYHVALTYNSGTCLAYMNGTLGGSPVTAAGSSINGFTIGGGADFGFDPYPFTGYVDDVRIYNSVLTLTQIYSIYALTRPISSWRDKSSNAYTANSFSNSVAAPSWVSNAPSVGRAVQYSAGNGSSIANFVLAQTMSIFEVYYAINQSNSGPFIEHGPDENSNSGFYLYSGGGQNFGINSGSGQIAVNVGNVTLSNTWQLIEGINPDPSSSSTMAFYVDGQVKASGSTQSGTTTVTRTLFINGRNGTSTLSYNTYLAELIIFSNALNTTQRQAVERYLSLKWGLSNFYTSIPGSISGLQFWMDGADTSKMTFPSGSNISGIADKATLGLTLSNLNSGYYPTFVSGLGVYLSNSSSTTQVTCQSLNNNTVWYVPTQNMTMFIAYKANSTDNLRAPVLIGGGSGFSARPNFAFQIQCGASEGTNSLWDLTGGSWTLNVTNNANTSTGLRVESMVSTPGATSGFNFINGIESVYSTNTSPYTSTYTNYPAVIQIAQGSLIGNRIFNGYIQEILFYSNALTSSERAVVQGYLARKWSNTTIPNEVLPLTHPFTSIRPFTRPFAPVDILGCALWLDGADYSTLTFSGANITAWSDKSGSSANGTATGTPTYDSSGKGVSFNGSSAFSLPNGTIAPGSSNFAIFVVCYPTNISGYPYVYGAGGSSADTGTALIFYPDGQIENGFYTDFMGIASAGSVSINNLVMFTSAYNGTRVLYKNGTSIVSGTPSGIKNISTSNNRIGCSQGNASYFYGIINELIVYNTALTSSQRQQVEGYLAWKWGLQGSLASTHPFYKFPSSSALPFLPTNITNCALWLDAACPTQFNTFSFSSGSNIRVWYDKSGSNNHATASAGAYPTYSYESNCVVWNGTSSSQLVLDPNITGAVVNKAFTIFVVSQRTVSSENWFMRGTNTAANSNLLIGHGGSTPATTIRFAYYGNDLDYGSVPTYTTGEGPSIISFHYSKPNRAIYYNGTLGSSDTNSTDLASWTGAMVGGGGGSWLAYQGRIFEIIIYGAVLSTSQRQMVEGYLAYKWGI